MSNVIGKAQGTGGYNAPNELPKDAAGDFQLPGDPTQSGASDMASYLKIMADMQAENRKFTLLSQILTMRHDAAKSAAKNIH